MIRFFEAKDAFLYEIQQDMLISKGYIPELTLKQYSKHLDHLAAFACEYGSVEQDNLDLKHITEHLIKEYLVSRRKSGKSASTINNELYCFKSFFKRLTKRYKGSETTVTNIAKDIPRVNHRYNLKNQMTEDHMKNFLDHIYKIETNNFKNLRNKVYFLTQIRFGLRPSEGLSLNLNSFAFTKHTLLIKIVGKGNQLRKIPLPLCDDKSTPIAKFVQYRNLVQQYLLVRKNCANVKNNNALFISQQGKRLSYSSIYRIFDRYLKELSLSGLGYSPHSLRHSLATRLLYESVPLKEVSEILGHKNPVVTATVYLHSELKKLRKGMEKGY